MIDLSHFKRGKIDSARMAGGSATKTAELFGVARSNDNVWENKTQEESKSCQIGTFGHKRIAWKDHTNTAPKIPTEPYDHIKDQVS